jgi:hypothetical protein
MDSRGIIYLFVSTCCWKTKAESRVGDTKDEQSHYVPWAYLQLAFARELQKHGFVDINIDRLEV